MCYFTDRSISSKELSMLNIVIPMAGAGSRFSKAGYIDPKPLIKIHDITMIQLVIDNIKPKCDHRFIFIVQNAHREKYNLDKILKDKTNNCEIIGIDGITEGAACTVLKSKDFINNNNPLMIANSDQFVDIDINEYINKNTHDGIIMTMNACDPKWSFIDIDENNFIHRVVEKKVISNEATVGIYNFTHGTDFVRAAETMILDNNRVNNEFYVAPVYNILIQNGKKFTYFNIGSEKNGMYGLGIPEDLNFFINNPISKKAAEKNKCK